MDLLNQDTAVTGRKDTAGFLKSCGFADCLRTRAAEAPENAACVYVDADGNESRVGNLELWNRVKTVANVLDSNELRGEKVILSYPPGLEFITGFLATVVAGAVAVPIPVLRRKDRHDRNISIVKSSGANWLLSCSNQIKRMQSHKILGPEIQLLATDSVPQGNGEQDWQPSTVGPEQLAVVQYTSGSTADPKGVMLTHRNLIHNTEMIARALVIRRDDFGISWLPHYHDMGLIGGILVPLLAGAATILISPSTFLRDPLLWLRLISKHRVTISGGPDFGYRHCVERITDDELAGLDLSCWRAAYVGAEPIRSDTLRRFAEKFDKAGFAFDSFFPCYGLAETTLIVTGGPPDGTEIGKFQKSALAQNRAIRAQDDLEDTVELVSSGESLTDETVKIVAPDTLEEVNEGCIGEIWVASPSVAQGYLNAPQKSEEIFENAISNSGLDTKFLRTGDLGFLLNRQLFVTGRLKDLIILRGVNHYPQDLEYTCESASAALRKSGIAAFSTEVDNQERLVIVAEMERSSKPNWETEFNRIRSSLATEHDLQPFEIVVIAPASLPKTSSGKLQRQACRRRFEENSLKIIASWKSANESVTAFLAKLLDQELTIDPSIRLADLGIDSVERANLIHVIEREFSIRIPDGSLRRIETISDLVDMISRHSNRAPTEPDNNVPASHFKIEEFPEVVGLSRTRALLSNEAGLSDPYFAIHEGITQGKTKIDGREVINFASYNYLGLSGRPEVSGAAIKAIELCGTSSGASRLISGNREAHEALETSLADFVGTEAAITFVSGHSTNETVIGHLFGSEDLILYDALAHNSITQGAKLSGAHQRSFAHNDYQALDQFLSESRSQFRRVVIVTEGLFGIDGDVPELGKFVEIKKEHSCLLMVDEAHSLGTLGNTGRGITEHCGVPPGEIDLIMGTLSKAFASCGGFIAGRKELIEYLRYSAPGFVFSVGMPPASAAAAHAALEIIRREPTLVSSLQERSRYFLETVNRNNIDSTIRLATPIFSLDLESPRKALEVSRRLLEKGVNAPPILYPAVSENSGKIRFFTCSTHTEQQIDFTLESLSKILRE